MTEARPRASVRAIVTAYFTWRAADRSIVARCAWRSQGFACEVGEETSPRTTPPRRGRLRSLARAAGKPSPVRLMHLELAFDVRQGRCDLQLPSLMPFCELLDVLCGLPRLTLKPCKAAAEREGGPNKRDDGADDSGRDDPNEVGGLHWRKCRTK